MGETWNSFCQFCFSFSMYVQEQFPELHVHFTSQGFHTSMYASSWFLTIFTTSLSLAVASRIMDMFLMDGIEVVFRVALAILSLTKTELLSLDMEGMLKVIYLFLFHILTSELSLAELYYTRTYRHSVCLFRHINNRMKGMSGTFHYDAVVTCMKNIPIPSAVGEAFLYRTARVDGFPIS